MAAWVMVVASVVGERYLEDVCYNSHSICTGIELFSVTKNSNIAPVPIECVAPPPPSKSSPAHKWK